MRPFVAHRFIELGELQELEKALAADHEMIYLEDVRENLNIRDKIAAAVGTIAPWAVRAWPDPDEAAVYLFTSGTEGQPKGVVLSHANLLANVDVAKQAIRNTVAKLAGEPDWPSHHAVAPAILSSRNRADVPDETWEKLELLNVLIYHNHLHLSVHSDCHCRILPTHFQIEVY